MLHVTGMFITDENASRNVLNVEVFLLSSYIYELIS